MSLKVIEADGTLSPAPRNLPNELFLDFERSDDQAIMAELQGAIVEEYVYSFKQGQATVMGLSLPGVMAVAQQMGGITCGQPIWTLTDTDITCDISATDHKVGLTVWGTATASLVEYNKPDKFARAKALSKAQRNAIRKVIPETVATQMLKTFMGEKRGGQPRQQPRRPEPTRQIAEATVEGGNVVSADGEIVGRLEQRDDALTDDQRQRDLEYVKGLVETAENAKELGQAWNVAYRLFGDDPEVLALFSARKEAIKAERRPAVEPEFAVS